MRIDSQIYKILNHLKENGNITPIEALNDYGCFRLAARISDLESLGYHIKHERKRVKARNGSEITVGNYSLLEEEAQ